MSSIITYKFDDFIDWFEKISDGQTYDIIYRTATLRFPNHDNMAIELRAGESTTDDNTNKAYITTSNTVGTPVEPADASTQKDFIITYQNEDYFLELRNNYAYRNSAGDICFYISGRDLYVQFAE